MPVKEFKLNSSVLDRYRWSDFVKFDNYTGWLINDIWYMVYVTPTIP